MVFATADHCCYFYCHCIAIAIVTIADANQGKPRILTAGLPAQRAALTILALLQKESDWWVSNGAAGFEVLACCCIQPRNEEGNSPMSISVAANSLLPASIASKADSDRKLLAQNCMQRQDSQIIRSNIKHLQLLQNNKYNNIAMYCIALYWN